MFWTFSTPSCQLNNKLAFPDKTRGLRSLGQSSLNKRLKLFVYDRLDQVEKFLPFLFKEMQRDVVEL